MFFYLLFWILIFIISYSLFGYTILLYVLVLLKKTFAKKRHTPNLAFTQPHVSFLVAAYNEQDIIEEKIKNTLLLNYPADKIEYLWVTDGSTDRTTEILSKYPQFKVLHQPSRKGKISAVNRAIGCVSTSFIVMTDANSMLNPDAIYHLIKPFEDPKIGCVAGEKRVFSNPKDMAAASGEGMYWKYESWLKQMDADLFSVVGAVGEIFAIRTELFQHIQEDTVVEDFVMSMNVIRRGFKISYAPNAIATESASSNIEEELKRKIRIAAGGFQAISRLKDLLNPFKYGIFSFQFFSHKIVRWTLLPWAFLLLFPTCLIIFTFSSGFYSFAFYFLSIFYLIVIGGKVFQNKSTKSKILFIPYYIFVMNWAVLKGFFRYLSNNQSVVWEKAARKSI